MSTELDTPIIYEQSIPEQRVDKILMNMDADEVEYHIGEYAPDENAEVPGTRVLIKNRVYFEKFSAIPPGAAKDDFKDVLDNIRALARNKGQLGAGTDTDPIG